MAVRPWRAFVCVVLCARVGYADVDFNRDIRPILAANCLHCHGPDENNRQAELRLDRADGIERVFVAKAVDESEAWLRVVSDDESLRMPPAESHRELKPAELQTLRRWIEQGAPYEGHWAFQVPEVPEVPRVSGTAWVRNPIDAFILARLEQTGLSPAEEADREQLIRRVTFDLTGLPPTLAEIDAFLADEAPNAYERVVDRLLRSAHFGERMALAWMDAARYGDTSVFHADGHRDMWPWRDAVIKAYNRNQPFDEFTVEQLAGDLLPDTAAQQLIASGFNRNNATTDEGGAIAEEYRVEYAVDRVKTTATVWMGLTLECAQCHDHKYDPISQTEYYRFYAFFNQAADPGMQTRNGNQSPVTDVFDPSRLAAAKQLGSIVESLRAAMQSRAEEAEPNFLAWADARRGESTEQGLPEDGLVAYCDLNEGQGTTVGVVSGQGQSSREEDTVRIPANIRGQAVWTTGPFGAALRTGPEDFIDLGAIGDFDRDAAFSYAVWILADKNATGAPLARMDEHNGHRGYDLLLRADGRLEVHIVHKWPDNAIKVISQQGIQHGSWVHVAVTYDGGSRAAGVKIYVDGVVQELDVERDALSETIRTEAGLFVGRRHPGWPFQGQVDEIRVYDRCLTDSEAEALAKQDPLAPLLRAYGARDMTAEQRLRLKEYYLQNHDESYQRLANELKQTEGRVTELEKPVSTAMIMQNVAQVRPTFVLDRGNYASPRKDQQVWPDVPRVLPTINATRRDAKAGPPATLDRLDLARWLVDGQHPLTARVTVNRYWYMLFGTGIVSTVEDFGAMGEPPSHPELLDWLATDFTAHGWNIKRTLKQMVMSNTYRQTSRCDAEKLQTDPDNRLLSRGPRYRLQAEFVRDNALAASGLLVRTIGGPGVKPYQPDGLWNEVSLDTGLRFVQDHGDKLYRRSMYTYWRRSAPAPSMVLFDAPTRDKCVVRRSRTNTPLQALVTLNDPQYVEAARMLAERALREGGTSLEDQITHAFRLATGTRPTPTMLASLTRAFAEEHRVFAQDAPRAAALLAVGESSRDETRDTTTHAAMTIVASIILNLDQTLTRG